MTMTFHEVYGTLPTSTLDLFRRCNVTSADWAMMLMRWGFEWGDENLPWPDIENFVTVHSQRGFYSYPLYGDDND